MREPMGERTQLAHSRNALTRARVKHGQEDLLTLLSGYGRRRCRLSRRTVFVLVCSRLCRSVEVVTRHKCSSLELAFRKLRARSPSWPSCKRAASCSRRGQLTPRPLGGTSVCAARPPAVARSVFLYCSSGSRQRQLLFRRHRLDATGWSRSGCTCRVSASPGGIFSATSAAVKFPLAKSLLILNYNNNLFSQN